jgi:hypothetical protein
VARALAVIAAVAMIVGAFVYRYGSPFDGGGSDGGDGGDSPAAPVYCAAELGADVCEAVDAGDREVVTEPASATADRLIKARGFDDADVAGWLAPGPWAQMVDAQRRLASRPVLFASKGRGLADTPLVAVTRKGQPIPGCPAEVDWRCIGDAAQNGSYRIGADANGTSSHLFLRAAALSGLFGNTNWATNDLDAPPEGVPDPTSWLAALDQRLAQAPGFGAPSVGDFVVKPGSVALFLTTGAGATSAPGGSFDVRTPAPAATIAATYNASDQGGHQIDADEAADALGAAGWTVRPDAKTQGLPSPGVLLALRET